MILNYCIEEYCPGYQIGSQCTHSKCWVNKIKYRVIAKFDNETRIYEDKMEWCNSCHKDVDRPCTNSACVMDWMNNKGYRDALVQGQIETAKIIQERKSKMTREEALNKIRNSTNIIDSPGGLVNALEALGLIKFEEVKKEKLAPRFESKEITHIYQYRDYGDIVIIEEEGYLEVWIGGMRRLKYDRKAK